MSRRSASSLSLAQLANPLLAGQRQLCRREDEPPLRLVLAEYEAHYNGRRPHRQLRPPRPDHPVAILSQKQIKRRAVLGGLLNEYEPAA
jgi:hypothetical protein